MAKRIVAGVTIGRASIALGAVLGGQGAISVALAQGASNAIIEVGECVNLQSPEERLACSNVRSTRSRRKIATRPPQRRSKHARWLCAGRAGRARRAGRHFGVGDGDSAGAGGRRDAG